MQSADGRVAEGFVSVAAYAEIARRAGVLGPRLLAVLAGTETPADVAAIMSWFHEDPRRLAGAVSFTIGGASNNRYAGRDASATVAVAELNSAHAVHRSAGNRDSRGDASWSRFIDHVFAAFRERRGPFGQAGAGHKGDDDEDDDVDSSSKRAQVDPAIKRSLAVFEDLFNLMLGAGSAHLHVMTAFDLTQYVCERLQPDFAKARDWLQRLVDVLVRVGPPIERRHDVAAAILTLLGAGSNIDGDRSARARLLRLGVEIFGDPPSPDPTGGFQSVLIQTVEFADLWARLKAVRTFREQVQAYLAALTAGEPSTLYGDLAHAAPEEWPVLQDAFKSERSRKTTLGA